MHLLDLTLDDMAANIALDEALLDAAESGKLPGEVLRLWEGRQHAVIIGRSSVASIEVDIEYCRKSGLAVIRRCSGGAAIVTGPGCLMFALILDSQLRPELEMIDRAHRLVLESNCAALGSLGIEARPEGTSDIAVGDRKVSGNSLRRKRRWMLYHGTLLYGLDGEWIQRCLQTAPRQPEYRRGRDHGDFVGVLQSSPAELRAALVKQWEATTELEDWPRRLTDDLVCSKYGSAEWNFSR